MITDIELRFEYEEYVFRRCKRDVALRTIIADAHFPSGFRSRVYLPAAEEYEYRIHGNAIVVHRAILAMALHQQRTQS